MQKREHRTTERNVKKSEKKKQDMEKVKEKRKS